MIDLTNLLVGGGSGLLGFVGAVVTGRSSRESAFNERVDKELAELRAEVALCRAERTEFAIVKIGVRMMIPVMLTHEPEHPGLRILVDALDIIEPDDAELCALLKKLEPGEDKGDEQDPPAHP